MGGVKMWEESGEEVGLELDLHLLTLISFILNITHSGVFIRWGGDRVEGMARVGVELGCFFISEFVSLRLLPWLQFNFLE